MDQPATSEILSVAIERIEGSGEDIPLPAYATERSAGVDLCACISNDLVLEPGSRSVVPTGIRIAIPTGHEGQVRPRSGLAARHGIGLLNSPGTIDADYRGEIGVILMNWGRDPFVVTRGMRIAQLVIAPVSRISWDEQTSPDVTARGSGGFGHTGS